MIPVLLFVVGGILVGGAISLRQQGAGRVPVAIVGSLAAIATAGGVLWLFPGEG